MSPQTGKWCRLCPQAGWRRPLPLRLARARSHQRRLRWACAGEQSKQDSVLRVGFYGQETDVQCVLWTGDKARLVFAKLGSLLSQAPGAPTPPGLDFELHKYQDFLLDLSAFSAGPEGVTQSRMLFLYLLTARPRPRAGFRARCKHCWQSWARGGGSGLCLFVVCPNLRANACSVPEAWRVGLGTWSLLTLPVPPSSHPVGPSAASSGQACGLGSACRH